MRTLLILGALLLTSPAYAGYGGRFVVTATPPAFDNHTGACDSLELDTTVVATVTDSGVVAKQDALPDWHPVAIEIRWDGALGRDSFVRLGCVRGEPERFECFTAAPGVYFARVRVAHAGGVSCWSRPHMVVALGVFR